MKWAKNVQYKTLNAHVEFDIQIWCDAVQPHTVKCHFISKENYTYEFDIQRKVTDTNLKGKTDRVKKMTFVSYLYGIGINLKRPPSYFCCDFDSLATGRCGCEIKYIIFKHNLDIAIRCTPLKLPSCVCWW